MEGFRSKDRTVFGAQIGTTANLDAISATIERTAFGNALVAIRYDNTDHRAAGIWS